VIEKAYLSWYTLKVNEINGITETGRKNKAFGMDNQTEGLLDEVLGV